MDDFNDTVKSRLSSLMDLLGLNEWTVTFSRSDSPIEVNESKELVAEIKMEIFSKKAHILFSPIYKPGDDDTLIHELLHLVLSDLGFFAEVVSSGHELRSVYELFEERTINHLVDIITGLMK